MYLHCPRCQISVNAAFLVGSSLACPRCGEPATEPLSLFPEMPSRYRTRKAGRRSAPPGRVTADRARARPSHMAHP